MSVTLVYEDDIGVALCKALGLQTHPVRELTLSLVKGETPLVQTVAFLPGIKADELGEVTKVIEQFELVPKGTLARLRELERALIESARLADAHP